MERTVLQSHTHGTSGLTSTKWGTENSIKPQKSHDKMDFSPPIIFSVHAHTKNAVSFCDCEHKFLHLVHTITWTTRNDSTSLLSSCFCLLSISPQRK